MENEFATLHEADDKTVDRIISRYGFRSSSIIAEKMLKDALKKTADEAERRQGSRRLSEF